MRWSGNLLADWLLMEFGLFNVVEGLMEFGLFNVVEGLIDPHLLKLHHVNETVPQEQWIYWDMGFLVWGVAMLVGNWTLWRAGKPETAEVRA